MRYHREMRRACWLVVQATNAGRASILLRTSGTAGDGFGAGRSEQIETQAIVDSFVLWQLRVT
ncbi:hypothetical protein BH11MYX2_BH11MYX2_18170 [soil metagenome]